MRLPFLLLHFSFAPVLFIKQILFAAKQPIFLMNREEDMVAFAISAIENDYEREFMIKLYNKYYSVSKNRAFAILHDFDAVEEVVQDAFVKLIEHLPTIMTL